MVKSMTGFGRAQKTINGRSITVEIKSVNNKYLELVPKITRGYGFVEDKAKSYLQSAIARGKVEILILIDSVASGDVTVQVNDSIVRGYMDAAAQISKKFGIKNNLKMSDVFLKTDVFIIRNAPTDEDKIWTDVRSCIDEALSSFIKMRCTEGEKLKEDVLSRADNILSLVETVEKQSPKTVEAYYQRLYSKLEELLNDRSVDEQLIVSECALFADRVAVAEETVRLRSHISQLKDLLESDEPIGRKLDFIVQEINRETNTIGSKCNDLEISKTVIEIKAETEKIREQIQNIE